jgi:predicted transcriptional regulator
MNEQVVEIVAAYLRNNAVAAADVPDIITQVHQTLSGLGQPAVEPPETVAPKPAVPVRRSVTDAAITCLECGAKHGVLRRHLHAAHGLTPEAYRQRWKLPADYPIVAKDYSVRRSAMAKASGLGIRGNTRRRKAN